MKESKSDPFVATITAELAREADGRPLLIDYQPGTREQHGRRLKHYEGLVGRLLLDYPRLDGESAAQWRTRVVSKSPRHEDANILSMAGRLRAIIAKMDRDEADEARRQEAASAARRKAEWERLRRAATVDVAELARLKRTIDSAADGERLLAQLHAAFVAHTSAQAARTRIGGIFENARDARQLLRVEGETLSGQLPRQPVVREAPAGAVAFASIIQQVLGLRRS